MSRGGEGVISSTDKGMQMTMQSKGKIASEADNAMKMIKKS